MGCKGVKKGAFYGPACVAPVAPRAFSAFSLELGKGLAARSRRPRRTWPADGSGWWIMKDEGRGRHAE